MNRPRKTLRRLFPSLPLSATILVFWLLMTDSFNLGQALLGLVLGLVVPLFAARLDREFARIGSLRPLPRLICVTLWDILMSNIRVAIQVLGPEHRIHPGFIWLPLDIANIHGIAALTSLITLTPGTVSAALSDDRKYLLVHVLHLDDPDGLIREIKTRYEAPLMEIFP
ncbi:Na+/H+ antiporter subunit E [Flavobacterium sp. MXW15]|uniref:Na+/H+ antiporter subunit E n=1 Tax=Xanthomonas chitinilytica TaxID=2989819 RepID=A0ABT3JWM4_9XANT|nr:Na+/H+ antiporter subunit E [Xanthomonas sp. H13-6]MCW4455617.1 Na+/H+ antiporter subunit E [Flavobacterium sp. MXW15]MCW4472897.1 Na+/H+ antiporter subunit E [Xanthomonas sp. H13-6]